MDRCRSFRPCVITLLGVSFLLMLLLPTSCRRNPVASSEPTEMDVFDSFFQEICDSISFVPRKIRTGAITRMQQCNDSLVYYNYLAVALKTCLSSYDIDSARLLVRQIEEYVRRTPATPGLADLQSECSNMKGNLFARTGHMDSAEYCFRDSYEQRQQGTKMEVLPDILINLADACNRQGKLDRGAYWYRRALLLCDSLGLLTAQKVPIYYGLAQVYSSLRVFDLCDHYYDLALRSYSQMLPFEKHFYLNNRGTSYYFRGDYRTATSYFKQAVALTAAYPDMNYELNLSRINLADCFLRLSLPDSATKYLSLCEPFFRAMKDSSALYYLDTQHIQLALLRKDLSEATRVLDRAVTPSDIDPDLIHIRNRYLRQYYNELGDYRTAYYYLEKDQRLDDSIRNERIRMRIADMTLRYQQDSTLMAHRLLLQEQHTEVLKLRQTQFVVLAFGFLALLIAYFVYVYNKKKRALLLVESRRTVSTLRLENIRNRLSPHFIFNILSQEMTDLDDVRKKKFSSLVKLMRRNLELAEQLRVTLSEELDFVRTYLELEQRSLGSRFSYQITIAPAINPEQVTLPSMLIQIPVENAVKHALKDKEGDRLLWITIVDSPKGVDIRITDNGGGYRSNSVRRGTGTGLKVIMQTIQILNQKNREAIDVSVRNVLLEEYGETGCQVAYYLPKHYDYTI